MEKRANTDAVATDVQTKGNLGLGKDFSLIVFVLRVRPITFGLRCTQNAQGMIFLTNLLKIFLDEGLFLEIYFQIFSALLIENFPK